MFEQFGINAGYVEELYSSWRRSPQSVPATWQNFFGLSETPHTSEAFPVRTVPAKAADSNGETAASRRESVLVEAELRARVFDLVNAYRVRGHLFAKIDPLDMLTPPVNELNLERFGLDAKDLGALFPTASVAGMPERASLQALIDHLHATYCGSIGVEFTHIEEPEQRDWLQERMESSRNRCALEKAELHRIVARLADAETFETFLDINFKGKKRFSAEGAESMIAMLDLLIEYSGAQGVDEILIGMAHRGRLNVLINIMGKNPRELFAGFDDNQPELFVGGGDVKYHLGYSSDWKTAAGKTVHLSLAFNPSHLEFVNPVVTGRARAKQDRKRGYDAMPLLIHGDAAFIGQGVVPETLNLAGLEGYTTGGTIHLVVNNQVGFTTVPEDSRATRYCTDITRMLKVPVFHVNGEDPEAVIQVTRLAVEFRKRFRKDVVIDMYCYRRYGHNENDEPRFTQPLMYKVIDDKIRAKQTVRAVYAQRLIERGQLTQAEADGMVASSKARLELALQEARSGNYLKWPHSLGGVWQGYVGGADDAVPDVSTAVSEDVLRRLATTLAEVPAGFSVHPKVRALLSKRKELLEQGKPFDWGTAEHLAFASLLDEGIPVRLTGQDARRGTFTHRQAAVHDAVTGERYVPLTKVSNARLSLYDSPLSETGVLGFEYGYSLDYPDALVIWEAQFGDFANGAQVIVDQFLVSAEDKWKRLSGLVMLLPHGYEGQGPEHSSARIERFLQMAAEDNIQVCNVTTPAQIFHLLRRQVHRKIRKPLIVFTPKSLLRLPEASSTLADLAHGRFQRTIGDPAVAPANAKRVLLCSGKVYYDLLKARSDANAADIAIVRLEQLYPLHQELPDALAGYPDGTPLVWVQEEPKNAGAWYFLHATLRDLVGTRLPLSCVARDASASPATGSTASHELEQRRLLSAALGRA
jgi:2-oxoglutarate dehydrogenase E1 component